MTVIPKTRRGH